MAEKVLRLRMPNPNVPAAWGSSPHGPAQMGQPFGALIVASAGNPPGVDVILALTAWNNSNDPGIEMAAQVVTAILDLCLAAAAVAVFVGIVRTRRGGYHDIKASEIDSDVAAGEELLSDALKEYHRWDKAHTGDGG
jgi:hypothetical protein